MPKLSPLLALWIAGTSCAAATPAEKRLEQDALVEACVLAATEARAPAVDCALVGELVAVALDAGAGAGAP